jgi:hypothetical protein
MDSPSFKTPGPSAFWQRLIVSSLIGFAYPFIILLLLFLSADTGFSMFHYGLFVFSPFFLCIFFYKLYRCRYYLIEVKIESDEVSLLYLHYSTPHIVKDNKSNFVFLLGRDRSTYHEYYTCTIKHKGQKLMKQYSEGGFKKSVFVQLYQFLIKVATNVEFESKSVEQQLMVKTVIKTTSR